jgi:hypothetical protein
MNEKNFIARNHCLKEFPPQEEKKGVINKIRRFLHEKYGIWDAFDVLPYGWRMYYYDHIKTIFKPNNKRIRKAIPRQYSDVSTLVVDVNFELLKAFYEDEYKADIVDWEATEQHSEFAKWLEEAYTYITKERPQLEKDLSNAYPPLRDFKDMFKPTVDKHGKKTFELVDDGIPYEVKYKEVNRIEEEIENKDTEVITELVKRRNFFWT